MHAMCRRMNLLALAAVFAAAGCGKGPQDEWAGLAHPDVLRSAGLEYYWHASAPLHAREQVVRMDRLDENVYLLTDENRVFVHHAGTGALRWAAPLADANEIVFPPVHANNVQFPEKVVGIEGILAKQKPTVDQPYDIVLFNTLSRLRVFRRADGKEIRNLELNPPANAGGAADPENFYVVAANGYYYAVRLGPAVKVWTLSADAPITVPPRHNDNILYVASDDGVFRAARTGLSGARIWRQTVGSPIVAPFHVDSRGCFVGSLDGRVHAYDPWAGREVWPAPFVSNGPIRSAIQVGGNSVFVHAEGDALYALDVATGRMRWRLPEGRAVLAVMDGVVYVLDRSRNLRLVDEMLGKVLTSLPLTGLRLFARDAGAATVYAATHDGRVFCIRPRKAPYLSEDILRSHGR